MISIYIKQVIKETKDAITLVFKPLSAQWSYRAGQFITLRVWIKGAYVHRCYSLCSAPEWDRYPAITIKRIEGGVFSPYVHAHVKEGSVLEASLPMGKFLLPAMSEAVEHFVLIAGGSGIVPLLGLLKSLLIKRKEVKVSLLYANRDEASIIYKDILDTLQATYSHRLVVTHILSRPKADWQGHKKRMDSALLHSLLPEQDQLVHYFLCAPQSLMKVVKETLSHLGVAKRDVHEENFDPYIGSQVSHPFTYRLDITAKGKRYLSDVSSKKTVLEASLEAGVDLPYACMRGICNTCRAKCVAGEVVMDEDEGLSEEEIKAGYVLTCVAHAKTKQVKIEI